eukprot:2939154-Rhodomonas_salina.1
MAAAALARADPQAQAQAGGLYSGWPPTPQLRARRSQFRGSSGTAQRIRSGKPPWPCHHHHHHHDSVTILGLHWLGHTGGTPPGRTVTRPRRALRGGGEGEAGHRRAVPHGGCPAA